MADDITYEEASARVRESNQRSLLDIMEREGGVIVGVKPSRDSDPVKVKLRSGGIWEWCDD